jgi:hypothetical protein
MAAIARRVGYNQAYLLGRFPGLCPAISTRHLAFQGSQKATRACRIHREVHEATFTVHQQASCPGHSKVKALRRRPVITGGEPARSVAWHEALGQLAC